MVFMEEKVNIKGPDSHQCSLVGGPGTIEAELLADPLADPFYPSQDCYLRAVLPES
jgi:hypothetical protein